MPNVYQPDMDLECSQDYYPFDILTDRAAGPSFKHAIEVVTRMCNRCPIKPACHEHNADELWLRAITGNIKKPPSAYPNCGAPAGHARHQKAGEKPCDPCRLAHNRDKVRQKRSRALTKAGMTDELRALHAAFNRARARREEIPEDVIIGERAYQSVRNQMRKAAA